MPLDGVLEAPAGPVTPALVGEGAELWSAGRQECDMPPGMSDVAPHLWMPVALRLLELLGDLQEGCCGGLNEHAYGPWDLYGSGASAAQCGWLCPRRWGAYGWTWAVRCVQRAAVRDRTCAGL